MKDLVYNAVVLVGLIVMWIINIMLYAYVMRDIVMFVAEFSPFIIIPDFTAFIGVVLLAHLLQKPDAYLTVNEHTKKQKIQLLIASFARPLLFLGLIKIMPFFV